MPLYPQYSAATSGSSIKEWHEVCDKNKFNVKTSTICCYPTDNFFISASATGSALFISSSDFSVSATGIVSASDLSLAGGSVGGLSVVADQVSVGDVLKLKESGDVTGSRVLFTGGRIAAFSLSDDAFSTDSFLISLTNSRFSLLSNI